MKKQMKETVNVRENLTGLLKKEENVFLKLRETVDNIFYTTQGGPFNIRQLAMTVEQDKELNNAIIQICQSNFYSGKNPIRQVSQAVRRLGPNGFRGVSMQAFLDLDVYYNPNWNQVTNSIRQYSIAVAHACRITSQVVSYDSDMSFLLGILHRIGISVTLLQLPSPKDDIQKAQKHFQELQWIHPSIGQYILQSWGMPSELIKVIGNYGQIVIDNKPNMLSSILIVAESCIQKLGRKPPKITIKDEFIPIPTDSFTDACSVLGLHQNDIPKILEGIQETLRSEA